MKYWLSALLPAFGLFSCLAAAPLHADETTPQNPLPVMEKAGVLLGEMKELEQEYLDTHNKHGMTPEKVDAMAKRTARKLAGYRNELSELLPKLNPDSEFAIKLAKFLAKWLDDAAFKRDLLAYDTQEKGTSHAEIVSLWFQVPDRRTKWKTLFPFFRP